MPRSETGGPPVSAEETKQCPFCAETIKAAAIKCRYCQSDLTALDAPPPPSSPPRSSPPPPPPPPVGSAPTETSEEPASVVTPVPDSLVGRRLTVKRSSAAPRRARPASTDPPARRSPARGPIVVTVAVALAVTLVFLVLALRDWRETNRLTDAVDAGKTVRAQVADDLETLLSYKYTTFDEDLAGAKKVMTSSFEKQYAPTVAAIRKRAESQQRTQRAHVAAVAVISQTSDRVEVLAFVDTVSTTKGSKKSQVLQNRVKVSFENVDGTWLVDDLAVPQS